MVYVGRDRIQIGSWKSSSTTANFIPFPARNALAVEAVHRTVAEASAHGFQSAFTAALTPTQAAPFEAAGFELHEELHLLQRPLTGDHEPRSGPTRVTRRARRADWPEILTLDGLAFDDFWQFDRGALADAVRATPRHRFQVIKSTPVAGYHVTGLAGANAYIQRVAVHPNAQGKGYGKALVNDSLLWSRRNGAKTAQVNTQITNERAVGLYEQCGFTLASFKLQVLFLDFTNLAEQILYT